ncbi:ribosomal RNA small subunit methyltransferase E [Fibrobacteria bacterium R8-3-H12]
MLGEATLSQAESAHIIRSFRAKKGDSLTLCDGKGRFADAELAEVAQNACKVYIKSISKQEPEPQVHLAVGCLSDGGEEEIVFHAAQMPLAAIHLLRTERSQEPRDSELSRLRRRMESKSLVALKQSRKSWLTEIKAPVFLNDFLENFKGNLIVCDKIGNSTLSAISYPLSIIIGPEGGFSHKELEAMKNKNAHFLSLGPTRLRSISAPIFALGKIAQ